MGNTVLGKSVVSPKKYDPNLLYALQRNSITLPSKGYDKWVNYECYWLNKNQVPQVGILEIYIPSASKYIIESKSFKLYCQSLAYKESPSIELLESTIYQDVTAKLQDKEIDIKMHKLSEYNIPVINQIEGECLDSLIPLNKPIECTNGSEKNKTFYTHLFKSNCPVTHQPDWATIVINYTGPTFIKEHLLSYLISFHNHQAFHETCIEEIWGHIQTVINPSFLSVYGAYTRRGGIEINPYRQTAQAKLNLRTFRFVRQ